MKNLRLLTDAELEAQTLFYVRQERKILHIILEHIAEIDRRELQYKSRSNLHEYLTQTLGYSSPSASRRIEAYELMKEVPDLKEKIEDGAIHLTHIGTLSKAIRDKEAETKSKVSSKEKQDLIKKMEYQTIATSQRLLCQELKIKAIFDEKIQHQEDGSVRITMTFTAEQFAMLEEAKNLSAHKLQQEHQVHSRANVIGITLKQYIKSFEPKAKKTKSITVKHSEKENTTNEETSFPVTVVHSVKPEPINTGEKILNSVTPRVRKELFQRDGFCQHKDPVTGKLCGSRFALQIDHKHSRWAGGTNEIQNLQVLCAHHNRYKYRKESRIHRQ